jgi:predicted transcriptional regulator
LPKSSEIDIERNVRIILQLLGNNAKHRTEWTAAAGEKGISTNQFNRILTELLKHELIKRLKRGVYERTEAGREHLTSLYFLSDYRCPKPKLRDCYSIREHTRILKRLIERARRL